MALVGGLGGCAMGLSGCFDASADAALTAAELVEVVAVGVLDGDEQEIFGQIADVRGVDGNSFLVLDQQAATLGWFDLSGGYRGGIRSQGSGPGELSQPTALGVSSSGRVAILDPPNGRYSFYDLTSDGVEYRGSTRDMPTSRGSICTIDGRFFLRSVYGGYLMHEFDGNGVILNSFGSVRPVSEQQFGPATAMVASQINDGHLACLGDPGRIVSMDTYLPSVRAYSLEGELLWDVELANFRPMQFTPAPQGGVVFQTDPEAGSHIGRGVLAWTHRSVLVQYGVTWPLDTPVEVREGVFSAVESRELSLSTGAELDRTDRLRHLTGARNELFYGFDDLPFPRAFVFRKRD